jgi:hypothetical protein
MDAGPERIRAQSMKLRDFMLWAMVAIAVVVFIAFTAKKNEADRRVADACERMATAMERASTPLPRPSLAHPSSADIIQRAAESLGTVCSASEGLCR